MSSDIYLPEECWEHVFRLLNQPQPPPPPPQYHHHYLDPISLVSKQFLSITNRLRSSFAIHDDHPDSFLRRLFHRFPNLTSLDLTRFHGDLNALLLQISRHPLPRLTSLQLFHNQTFPAHGLRALAQTAQTLTSLTCYHDGSSATADLRLITDCFPSLQELRLTFLENKLWVQLFPKLRDRTRTRTPTPRVEPFPLPLPKLLRKVTLSSGPFIINDEDLISVCKNSEFLEELVIFNCPSVTQHGIASAIRKRPELRSFSVDRIGRGSKQGDSERPFVTASFIDSLVSLKSLACLCFRYSHISDELLCSIAEEGLPLKKLVLDDCSEYTYAGISFLLSRCKFVQHLVLRNAEFLNGQLVEELSLFLGNLISLEISDCKRLTESALFALIRNCSLLSEIKINLTGIGKMKVQYFNAFVCVNPQVKSLHLACNPFMGDETIKMLSLVCPNLELLDLRSCRELKLSEGVVVGVLRRCRKIRHLSVGGSIVKLPGMNFEVPNVEVLSLAHSEIDDETLSVVSKRFCGLKYLDLEHCPNITDKGVRQVVGKCKQLREINLSYCNEVAGDVVDWMVFSRLTLRKIVAPPHFHLSRIQSDLFLHHGCLVCLPQGS